MAGNSIGQVFRITTFGESHGKGIGVIVDGCPPGITISQDHIQHELDKRKPGQSPVATSRKEDDRIEILSGIFKGKSTGTPIAMLIRNKDADSSKYENIKNLFRPGHADYTYFMKYGTRDYRGSGRASGRETAARVAAGAIAKIILSDEGINIRSYTIQIGKMLAKERDMDEIDNNIVRCPDRAAALKMIKYINSQKKKGDSVGGIVETIITGIPAGLGEPVFDKLDADISKAVMSIGATKGIEFGAGFGSAKMKGSEHNDELYVKDDEYAFKSNNAGGILGGISSGQDIIFRTAVKPTSSIKKDQITATIDKKEAFISVEGRHDPCICPRIAPVIEAMAAVTLADHLLRNRAQCGGR